jgi:hypothetical protein
MQTGWRVANVENGLEPLTGRHRLESHTSSRTEEGPSFGMKRRSRKHRHHRLLSPQTREQRSSVIDNLGTSFGPLRHQAVSRDIAADTAVVCVGGRVGITSRAVEPAGDFPAGRPGFGAAEAPPDNGQAAGESTRAGAEYAGIEGRFKIQDQLRHFSSATAVTSFAPLMADQVPVADRGRAL